MRDFTCGGEKPIEEISLNGRFSPLLLDVEGQGPALRALPAVERSP